jgi:hypothetical protein
MIGATNARDSMTPSSMTAAVAAAVPALYAAAAGILQWLATRTQPLGPDAQAFLGIASSFSPDTLVGGPREPVWVTLMAIPVGLVGPNPDVPRLMGVIGFVLMIVAFQSAAWNLFGRTWAIISALLLATRPWLAFQAARGLREETAAALILLFGIGIVLSGRRPGRYVWLALGAALIALLRWDSLLLTIPVLGVALLFRRIRLRYWVTCAVLIAAVVSPLVVGNWVKNGDPMYHSNIHARFFRNVEFQGKPGFLTPEEVAANSFGGPPTTWAGYLLGLHTPVQLAQRAAIGAAGIPYGEVFYALFYPERLVRLQQLGGLDIHFAEFLAAGLLAALGLLGGVFLLLGRAWPLGLILFLSIIEFAPIGEIFDPRLAITADPFLLLGCLEMLAVFTRRRDAKVLAERFWRLASLGGRAPWTRGAAVEPILKP